MSVNIKRGEEALRKISAAIDRQTKGYLKVDHIGLPSDEEFFIFEFLKKQPVTGMLEAQYLKEARVLMGYPVVRTQELSVGIKINNQ